MADLLQVPTEDVAKTWPYLRERVDYGVERSRDRMTADGVRAKAESGEWDLHLVLADDDEMPDGPLQERILCVLATQIFEEMTGRQVCAIRFLGGVRRVEWIWLIAAVELWALKNGCHMMSFVTRRGLAKELRDYDYRQTSVLLEKELKPFKANDDAGRQNEDRPVTTEHRSGGPRAVQPGIHERRQSA